MFTTAVTRPTSRRTWPPGLCPGATVATVEHGVPLMRSKWVHHLWTHQEGEQGKGSRLADGAPICPATTRQGRHRQPRLRAREPSGVTPNPADDAQVPGTRTPGRRPGSSPGANLHTHEEDKLASPGWKLPEDLGAKKMEAPWGTGTEKLSVSVRPPWKRWATAPNPPQKNTWTRRGHVAPDRKSVV